MNELERERLRGLVELLGDGLEHGSAAVEAIHRETVRRPLAIVASIPPLARPARALHGVHELALSTVYGGIRAVGRLVRAALARALSR